MKQLLLSTFIMAGLICTAIPQIASADAKILPGSACQPYSSTDDVRPYYGKLRNFETENSSYSCALLRDDTTQDLSYVTVQGYNGAGEDTTVAFTINFGTTTSVYSVYKYAEDDGDWTLTWSDEETPYYSYPGYTIRGSLGGNSYIFRIAYNE